MASEIEEHFRLDFKVDCFRSGSISFGRFESEAALCWERWSSFTHNRYLEEVKKCSTPGLVIEKKAYFEARLKKKGGFLGLSSCKIQNETECRTSENEKISPSPQFGESLNVSSHGNKNAEMQQEFGSSNLDGVDNVDSVSEDGKVEEDSRANLESVISTHTMCKIIEKLDGESTKLDTSDVSNLTIGMFDDHHEKSDASCNCSSSKEKNSSQAENTKRRVSIVSQSRRSIVIDKDLGKKPSKTVNNVLMRPKSDNKTSKASAKQKATKHNQPGKKANGVKEIKRGEKESEVFRKLPNRVHQSVNRIKAEVSASQPCVKRECSRFRFKCNESAERTREEKSEAEIKQVRERLSFKATPLPSFYRRDSDRNKIKSSRTGCRASVSSRLTSISRKNKIDPHPPQASGGTSCHSTVTSDGSPSSPAAEISNQVGLKKEKHKDKITSLPKHKMMDGKQKKRIVRAS